MQEGPKASLMEDLTSVPARLIRLTKPVRYVMSARNLIPVDLDYAGELGSSVALVQDCTRSSRVRIAQTAARGHNGGRQFDVAASFGDVIRAHGRIGPHDHRMSGCGD